MKIVFVINQLDSGGAEQQLVTLCEGLRKRGHQAEVISIYDRLELRSRLDAIGVRVTVGHKYSKLDLTVLWRLRHLIKKINPDLVHAYLPASSLFTGMTKWMDVSIPVLQSERDIVDFRSKWRVWLDNVVRRRVVKITCNAEAIRRYLIEKEDVPREKIAVIYNGLASERRTRPGEKTIDSARHKIGAPAGSFVVICLANFRAQKQHHILLRAFAQARERANNLFLVLVGKGPQEQSILESIKELGLADSSRVIRDCMNPVPLLCASNAAMLTSSSEGCSNALLEAMAMGLPIVTSDAGGNGELVTHGLGGFVCRVGDVRSFADSLVRLAKDRSLSHEMGRYNIGRVTREFTDDIMVERSITLYKQILNETAKQVG